MNTPLLERFLICYLVVFFGMRSSNDLLNAIGLIDTSNMQVWPYYVMALAIAGLFLIITTAGKNRKSD